MQATNDNKQIYFNFSSSNLKEFPSFKGAPEVEEIDIRENQIKVIPKTIGNLLHLRILQIGGGLQGNLVCDLPNTMNKLVNLTTLNLDSNKFKEIPKVIFQLTNLKQFSLANNQIEELPESISQLTNLIGLKLGGDDGGNLISTLPDGLFKLTKLTGISIEKNNITEIPKGISRLKQLKRLYAGDNRIISVSSEISKLLHLEILQFGNSSGGNQLTHIPHGIEKLTSLTDLSFTQNKISNLPERICHLTLLKFLHLSHNRIKSLPKDIEKLTNLTVLVLGSSMGGNNITDIPNGFSKLTNLQQLSFVKNSLIRFPLEICNLNQLSELFLSENNFTTIPQEISKLTKLHILTIFRNPVKSLPTGITKLVNLKNLGLNPDLESNYKNDSAFSLFFETMEKNAHFKTKIEKKETQKAVENSKKTTAKKRKRKKPKSKTSPSPTSLSPNNPSITAPLAAENTQILSASITPDQEKPIVHLVSVTEYEREQENLSAANTIIPSAPSITTTTSISPNTDLAPIASKEKAKTKKKKSKEKEKNLTLNKIEKKTIGSSSQKTYRIILVDKPKEYKVESKSEEGNKVEKENKEGQKDLLAKPKKLFNKISSFGKSFCDLTLRSKDMIKVLQMLNREGIIQLITKNPEKIYALNGNRKLYLTTLHEPNAPEKLRAFLAPIAQEKKASEETLQVIMNETIQSQLEEAGHTIKFSQLMNAIANGEKRGKFKRLKQYSNYEGKLFSMKLDNHDRLYFTVQEWENDNPTMITIISAKGHR